MAGVIGIDHVQVSMPVGQEPAARAFYAGILGLEEVPKPAHLAVSGGCWFVGGGANIHLGVERDFRPAHKAHPALLVDDLESFAAGSKPPEWPSLRANRSRATSAATSSIRSATVSN